MEATIDLLNPEEARKILRVGRNTIYRLMRDKELPSVRVGEKLFINRNSLKNWLQSQEKRSGNSK